MVSYNVDFYSTPHFITTAFYPILSRIYWLRGSVLKVRVVHLLAIVWLKSNWATVFPKVRRVFSQTKSHPRRLMNHVMVGCYFLATFFRSRTLSGKNCILKSGNGNRGFFPYKNWPLDSPSFVSKCPTTVIWLRMPPRKSCGAISQPQIGSSSGFLGTFGPMSLPKRMHEHHSLTPRHLSERQWEHASLRTLPRPDSLSLPLGQGGSGLFLDSQCWVPRDRVPLPFDTICSPKYFIVGSLIWGGDSICERGPYSSSSNLKSHKNPALFTSLCHVLLPLDFLQGFFDRSAVFFTSLFLSVMFL